MFGQKSSDDYIDDANKSITQGFNEASSYEAPYTTYGSQDFDSARNFLYKSLGGREDYSSNFLKYLSMSPEEMVDELIGGYSESPEAQEEEKYSLDAEDNALTASGMGGSGTNQLADAEIGNTIFNQDESRYNNQILQALGIQGQITKGYNAQTNQLMKDFQDLLKTESGAANTMAGNALRAGTASAQADERGALDNSRMAQFRNPVKSIASILGSVGGLYEENKIANLSLSALSLLI